MKTLLVVVVVLVVAAVGLGYWQGWFTVTKEDGKLKLKMDPEKFKADKVAFTKKVGEQTKAAKENLAHLKEKIKSHTGADKDALAKEIDELQMKHDKLEKQINAVEDVSEEKFAGHTDDLKKELDEVDKKIAELQKKLEKK
jgi:hypothetical protein